MKINNKFKEKLLLISNKSEYLGILENIFQGEYSIVEGNLTAEDISEKVLEGISGIVLDEENIEISEVIREINLNIPIFLITLKEDCRVNKEHRAYITDILLVTKSKIFSFFQKRVENAIELYYLKSEVKETIKYQNILINNKEKNIKLLNRSIVETLALSIEFRSEETGEHVQHIRELTFKLLTELKRRKFSECESLTNEGIESIAEASILHDIGKIAIPDAILKKPGKLTEEEFEIMKTHSLKGAEILSRMPDSKENSIFKYAFDICLYHHERWDGKGYPEGLVGNRNPIWAQVVGLADVYDALTSKRCYKRSYTREEAVDMILEGKCGKFNPELLAVFVEIEKEL